MRKIATLIALTGMLGFSACDKKEEKKEDKKADAKKGDAKKGDAKKADAKAGDAKGADAKGGDAKGGDAKADGGAAAGGDGEVELEKLGLKAKAPAGSSVGDAIVGEGVMIQGPDLVVTVEVASDSRPKTEEAAKKDVDIYTPKNLVTEKLEDGWSLTFDNEGGMGANFFVQVRRDIDGKSYWCETTASKPEQQANALAFCKSLAK